MKSRMHTFPFDYYSEIEERQFTGNFTTKKLTLGDISRMGVIKAQLCGGLVYDPVSGKGVETHVANVNEMIAHCKVALVNHPDWWNPEEFIDPDLLNLVYKEVLTFENSFRRSRTGENVFGGGSQGSSTQESQGQGGSSGPSQDLVDKKIPQVVKVG